MDLWLDFNENKDLCRAKNGLCFLSCFFCLVKNGLSDFVFLHGIKRVEHKKQGIKCEKCEKIHVLHKKQAIKCEP